MQFTLSTNPNSSDLTVRIYDNINALTTSENLRPNEVQYLEKLTEKNKKLIVLHRMPGFLAFVKSEEGSAMNLEHIRRSAASFYEQIVDLLPTRCKLVNLTGNPEATLAFLEGFSLRNYQFGKYKTAPESTQNKQVEWEVADKNVTEIQLKELSALIDAVLEARNLVNEPQNTLTATALAHRFEELGNLYGFETEILEKRQIESLKMGGLLSVNKGSTEPPTFTIATYKPENAVNHKPLVLVGKGVVYDTGGLSLKPTPDSMDIMKCDMAGAATVIGTMQAIASNKLPLYVIALIPATDNRPNENAYAPGDVITMYNGTTVEVKNTDAEGRLILADALTYAEQFNPALVADFATLTGASVRAIGGYGSAFFSTANQEVNALVHQAANQTFERIMEFPLWQDYFEELKSDIADLSNLGKGNGGHISAAKFLEYFAKYPWMHFDIAGPAFIATQNHYQVKGATGVGVRLMYTFAKHFANNYSK
ncbi:MAG: leucyl aminopeptidase family protein [Luteibaculaceae bacterium]